MSNSKYIVLRDCFCEHYLHEITNYPREGLKELKLQKGDIVEHIEDFQNFIGFYYRVQKDGVVYDVLPSNLSHLSNTDGLLNEIKKRKEQIIEFQEQIDNYQKSIDISQKHIDDCEEQLKS